MVFELDADGYERTKLNGEYLLLWPLPDGFLRAGSVPFVVDETEFGG
ncbi:hypothetical protein [Corallincola holothuriorum]|nr:hypothetical protein [Corallincola holothuriorum]